VNEFLAMGGYGAYVWSAYGITLLALLLLFFWSWYGARAREVELEQVRKLSRSERRAPSSATLREPGSGSSPSPLNSQPSSSSQPPSSSQPNAAVSDAGSGAS
jgi:heme exporter protein D